MDDWDNSILFFERPTRLRRKFPRHSILTDVNSYLHTAESIDNALLKIIIEANRTLFPQEKIDVFVTELLIRGAHIDARDEHGNTPLHLAARMGYPELAKDLLEWGADANTVNGDGQLPLEVAIMRGLETGNSRVGEFARVAVIVIKEMEPERVRDTFITTPEMPRKIDFRELLFKEGMKDVGLAVLGTLIEPLSKTKKSVRVNYSLLETNRKGEIHAVPLSREVSTLEAIVHANDMEILVHPVVRLLIESRWRMFARSFLIASFLYWLLLMGFLTTALVLAALKKDPRYYNNSPLDIFRGVCEGITLLLITISILEEFHTIYLWKTRYFTEYTFFFFCYINVLTALFLYILIPLRVVGLNVQWIFAAFAYAAHSIVAFRYLLIIRKIGKYVVILWHILRHDLVPFIVVSIITLLTFTGGLYFLLREEEKKTIANNKEEFVTSLDAFPGETKSYPLVFLTGIRMMIEGSKIIDYYHGFGWLGITAHLLSLFFVVVVLQSLLIAQMNHTYSNIQQEADAQLILDRARSIIFIQRAVAGLPGMPLKRWFVTEEVWRHPNKILQSIAVGRKVGSKKALAMLEHMVATQRNLVEELRDSVLFEHRKLEEKLAQLLDTR